MPLGDTTSGPALLQSAEGALGRGWSIVPTKLNKKPAVPQWKPFQSSRATPDLVREWCSELGDVAGLAVVTGAVSKLLALDFDGDAGIATMRRLGLRPHVKTGSGAFHVYFEYPGWHVTTLNHKSKRELAQRFPGLDIRGDGGYAIFCGRNESGEYEALRDLKPDPLTVLPDDLREFLGLNRPPTGSVPSGSASAPFTSQNGNDRKQSTEQTLLDYALKLAPIEGRNNAGFWLACQLRDNGYSRTEAERIMHAFADTVLPTNAHGAPERYTVNEALASLDQAYARLARTPWSPGKPSSVGAGRQAFSYVMNDAGDDTPQHCTDLGNARRLVARHGIDLRYSFAAKKWLVWDRKRWEIDEAGEIARLAKATVFSIYRESAAAPDGTTRAELAKHAARSEAEARIGAMISLATSEPGIPVTPGELDEDPWLLNCQNGTLDLHTGRLLPHIRENLCTKQTPVNLDANATCPTWNSFLARILGENASLAEFVQRAVGYTLTGMTTEEVLFLLYGTGANGKTTFLETLKALLGDYATPSDFDTFLAKKNDDGRPRNDLARLKGARFVTAVENVEGSRLAEHVVKQVTGRDTIVARFLFREFFEFVPQFKLFLAANHKPRIAGTDEGIWRRIRLLPFTVTIPEAERDKDLREKLQAELPGILNWALHGCLEWQRIGLGECPAVIAATAGYRREMDSFGDFLEDCCVVGLDEWDTSAAIYARYREWCEPNGYKPSSRKTFGMKLGDRGFKPGKQDGERGWSGLSVGVLGGFGHPVANPVDQEETENQRAAPRSTCDGDDPFKYESDCESE